MLKFVKILEFLDAEFCHKFFYFFGFHINQGVQDNIISLFKKKKKILKR